MQAAEAGVGDESEALVKVSVQVTTAQFVWLQERARRLGVHSIAAVTRMVLQEVMNAEYRATTTDEDASQ